MQQSILFGVLGLLVGLFVGFFGANSINKNLTSVGANDTTQTVLAAPPAPANNSTGGMLPDVNETIQKAEVEPENFAAQMKTGDMYAQIGRFAKAVEFYKRGLLLSPDDFNANVVLANALFDSQRFEEASDYYSKAVRINGKDINARTDLGTTYVERRNPDYEQAIKEFQAALAIDPKHEPSLYYLGIAYHRKGDKANADKALNDLRNANPASPLIARLEQNMAPK